MNVHEWLANAAAEIAEQDERIAAFVRAASGCAPGVEFVISVDELPAFQSTRAAPPAGPVGALRA